MHTAKYGCADLATLGSMVKVSVRHAYLCGVRGTYLVYKACMQGAAIQR